MHSTIGRRLSGLAQLTAAIGLAALAASPAAAQTYPQRHVTFVSPFPAGGATDLVARIFAQKLQVIYGQPFVVENRAGATGLIGEAAVQRAEPDGYTILIASNSSHVIAPLLTQSKKPFDPVNDFAPITMLSSYPLALAVPANSPFKTVADLVAEAKRRPGALNFGSVGQGSVTHLVGEQFAQKANIKIVHIPYKGTAALTTSIISGEVDLRFDSVGSTKPLADAGQLKVLATTGATRSQLMPDVPTLRELGFSDVDAIVWVGAIAPKGTPEAILSALRDKMKTLLDSDREVQAVLSANGMDAKGTSGKEFAADMSDETNRWTQLIGRIDLPAR